MSDPRVTPDPAQITMNELAQVTRPVVDLCRTPNGSRDRQLLAGAGVTRLAQSDGWAYVQANRDGYCGYVEASALKAPETPTHKVTAPGTHAYEKANIKSDDLIRLSHGACVTVFDIHEKFCKTALGFIPSQHLAPLHKVADDPAEIAALFLGTPYLWGGNSRDGIDCSGLIQAALHACGIDCPGDSDFQIILGADADTPYCRNDLLFWKGHVALVTDPETLLHANAHKMSVTYEPITDAITRIENQGDGPVTAHRRLQLPNG